MKLINKTTLAEIVLPDDLLWEDEFTWGAVESTIQHSLSGALHIQSGTMLAGRPITLVPPDDQMAWISRTTVGALVTAAALVNQIFTLEMGTAPSVRQFDVRFRHADKAVEARPIYRWQQTSNDAWYLPTIRLIEV